MNSPDNANNGPLSGGPLFLFDRNRFREIARAVDVKPFFFCEIIRKKLERHDIEYGAEHFDRSGYIDDIVCEFRYLGIAFGGHSDDRAFACLDFMDVRYHFFVHAVFGRDGDGWKMFVDHRDGTVLHLPRAAAFRVDI